MDSKLKQFEIKETKVQLVPILECDENSVPIQWLYFMKMEDEEGNKITCEFKFLEEYVKKCREDITRIERENPLSKIPIKKSPKGA